MCIPDLALICEIMLMAEGFQASKMLSRKFVILYKLCEDLLSKSQHYDWKLRAIKTTLYVAGGMKRSAPELNEEQVRLWEAVQAWVACPSHPWLDRSGPGALGSAQVSAAGAVDMGHGSRFPGCCCSICAYS